MKFAKPQRVLMTADPIGGVWTYALELCRAFESCGIEVALATMGARLNKSQEQEAARSPNIQVFQSSYKLEWMDSPWADVDAAGEWLLDIERQFRPEVIHLNGYAHGSLPWHAPKIVVGHSCALSWWKAVKHCDAPAEWDSYRHRVNAGLQSADMVVAPSQAMLDSLQEHYEALSRCKVIPNGRRLKKWTQMPPKEHLILSAGRIWDEAKNISTLKAIAPSLPWPVVIAGQVNNPQTDHLVENRHHPGASLESRPIESHETNVWRLGQLAPAELQSWFCRASIYTLPARYEPFGLSALEAASCGCALVLGDIPSLREVWGDEALFVSPDDQGELQSVLEDLISSESRRQELANHALRRAADFTPEQMAKSYLLAYSEVLERECHKIQEEATCVS
jgi:glycogen(starch) synthase